MQKTKRPRKQQSHKPNRKPPRRQGETDAHYLARQARVKDLAKSLIDSEKLATGRKNIVLYTGPVEFTPFWNSGIEHRLREKREKVGGQPTNLFDND